MWISRREIARLERERNAALQRAKNAEEDLRAERQSKDWMITQLTSRFVTRQGGYGLDHEPPKKIEPSPYTHEPTQMDLDKLEYYKQCARQAGRSEEEARQTWEAEMRGESVRYEYEQEQ